ncbi:hypothetical protein HYT18_04005 [Candidatus Microgenomates bacterium]|nr:hypothetical protein [Candidatus Microgenomates bacterium]
MRKCYRFQVLGYSLILSFLFTVTCTLSTAHAADSTPSANIKAKLEELKKEIASKAAKLKLEVNRKLQNKAYIGNLKAKSETSLTLATRGGPKIVTLNQDTIYEGNVKNKKLSLKTLAEEDFVAALGDIDETGVLTAKKVILLPTTIHQLADQLPTYLWGQVISISDSLVTLKTRELKNVAVSVNFKPDIKIKLNDFVIVVGSKNKNEIYVARFVYVISQGGIIKLKKVATPSAQVTTKSATPSGKKK